MDEIQEITRHPVPEQELAGVLEAFLFAAGDPITLSRLSELCEVPEERVLTALLELEARYEDDLRSGITLRRAQESYVLTVKPQLKSYMERMFAPKQKVPLSAAAYETLAVVAYNQPVTRSQIEAVRGVSSDSIVSRLLDRGWIRECGTLEAPGHPSLFETTQQFLLEFGIASVRELPALELMMYGTIRDLEQSLQDASGMTPPTTDAARAGSEEKEAEMVRDTAKETLVDTETGMTVDDILSDEALEGDLEVDE